MGLIFFCHGQKFSWPSGKLLDFDTSCSSVLVGLIHVLALWGRKHQGNKCGHHPWFSTYRSVNQHFWGIPAERQRSLILINSRPDGFSSSWPIKSAFLLRLCGHHRLLFHLMFCEDSFTEERRNLTFVQSVCESLTVYLINFNGPLFNLNTINNI